MKCEASVSELELVFVAARDPSRGQQSQTDLEKQGIRVIYQQLDISNSKSIQEFKNFLVKKYGGLDVLVNNAAISYKPASTASLAEQARETVCVNFTGTLNVCRALFPLLRPHASNFASLLACQQLAVVKGSSQDFGKEYSSMVVEHEFGTWAWHPFAFGVLAETQSLQITLRQTDSKV
ncbi:carbonyl reductase [NADPH] 1-like [Corticium candelabrum]|uniref:carbonyl reductase [NADPH] 1-like n=1 Tax=Corticium candelabrum TaxID=121492 RepID=UPI002E259D6C|nr:carbonyl reductase [NADPH] 1-like [Corticium candelabrum]